MANWIGQKEESHDGCIMILNLGQDNIHQFSKQYVDALRERVALAHADGFMVIWAFDDKVGPFKIPDDFDNIEGMSHVRMMFDVCNRRDSNFALMPEERMKEFKAIEQVMRNHEGFRWRGTFAIGGSCTIADQAVLMPVTEV